MGDMAALATMESVETWKIDFGPVENRREMSVSIDGEAVPYGLLGVELSSQKLVSRFEKELFFTLFKGLKEKGWSSHPVGSATHIHVAFPEPTLEEVALLTHVFYRVQKSLYNEFGVTPERLRFAEPIPARIGELSYKILKGHSEVESLQAFLEYNFETKRFGMNWSHLFTYGTVELRPFNSTASIDHIDFLIEFSQRLVQATRQREAGLMALVERGPGEDMSFFDLVEALGMELNKAKRVTEEMRSEAERALEERREYLKSLDGENDDETPFF
jgi:hypothetical protein